ncbi:MAG: radical SAM protein [Alphaproteobacteria bacterium]|nr:radical SAM protein [Alphaproteobacteria bacterium]
MTTVNLSIRDFGDHACLFIPVQRGVRVLWELTKRCNLACKHCFVPPYSKERGDLSTAQCISIMDSFPQAEVTRIIFSGGEPLTRRDIPELIQASNARGIQAALCTNATLVTDSIARDLYRSGLREAFVSLDGATAEVHDGQRGLSGSFDRTIKGIKTLKYNGLTVDISCIPTKLNIHDLQELPRLCSSLGCSSITFGGWFPKQNMRGTGGDLTPDAQSMTKFLHSFREVGEKANMPMHTSRLVPHAPLEACPAGVSIIGIDASGHYHPCLNIPTTHSEITDALKASITEILKRFKKIPELPTCAKNCPSGEECFGGCPADKINGVDRVCSQKGLVSLQIR